MPPIVNVYLGLICLLYFLITRSDASEAAAKVTAVVYDHFESIVNCPDLLQ
jgi:hypothetical protein